MTVKIWDASSGACLQTLNGHSSSNLTTVFTLQKYTKVKNKDQQPLQQDLSISADNIWMSNDSYKLLWLPSEYRPSCTAMSGKCIGVGTGNGKVWIGRVR
jgi:WD40 repeat protein